MTTTDKTIKTDIKTDCIITEVKKSDELDVKDFYRQKTLKEHESKAIAILKVDFIQATRKTEQKVNLVNTAKFCNVNHYNDVDISIKVQQFRSRYAKYLYHKCTGVVSYKLNVRD